MTKQILPYGSWVSPISLEKMTAGNVGLSQVSFLGDQLYWLESRASEKGRVTLVTSQEDQSPKDMSSVPEKKSNITVVAEPASIRSRVHEYGGGAFCLWDDKVYFSDATSKNLMMTHLNNGKSEPLLAMNERGYADFQPDVTRQRLICVTETYFPDSSEPKARISAVTLSGEILDLCEGADFYSSPRVSPNGEWLVWLEWSHPNMPWDESRIMRAKFQKDGTIEEPECVAGGKHISVLQPEFSKDGKLFFMSDEGGYWNLNFFNNFEKLTDRVHIKHEGDCAFPHWVFGMRSYAIVDENTVAMAYAVNGDWSLALVRLSKDTYEWETLDLPYVGFDSIVANSEEVAFIATAVDKPSQIVKYHLKERKIKILAHSSQIKLSKDYISEAETVIFPTVDENGNNREAYAYFYPPKNGDFSAKDGELPPVIVRSHGGPTGQSGAGFALKYQFWTSRGFAVLDVNYSGSTGYGRAYRDRLLGQWGVVDVIDCQKAAEFLVKQGRVDGERLIIAGSSAGGYTTLAALTFTDHFKAGCSSYGIGDLEMLANDTHKFESRYLDKLIGEWPADADLYRARSPIKFTEKLNCPVLFLQGEEDKVVPPNQADTMSQALREKGVPVAYVLFAGEGHGFRQADNIQKALATELSFYRQVFNISADEVDDICVIDNI